MADDFDPDAYLGGGGSGFDPDAYLKGAAAPSEPGRFPSELWKGTFPKTQAEQLEEGPHETSIYGTALPKRADTYAGRVGEQFNKAIGKIGEAAKNLYGAGRDPREGPGFPGERQVGMAKDLAAIAGEAWNAITSPATAALTYGEKYTGIPAEEMMGAAGAAGTRGARAPGTSPLGRGIPREPTPLPPTPSGDTPPTGRPGLAPNVRLYPPDLPAGSPVRDSVGAARAQSALEQAAPEAQRILEDQARQEGWTEHTLDQLEGEQSPHAFLGESSPNFEALTKANQTLPGAARTETQQAVNQRHRERGERVNAIHDEYLGPDVDRTQWETTLRQAAQNESRPFWQQFDATPVAPSPDIETILQRPGMRRAMAAANDTLLNRGLPVDNGFPVLGEEEAASFGDNATRSAAERQATETRVPTARAFQLAKEHIDGVINDAVRSGRTQVVRTYTQLKNDLDAAIAAHPNADIARIWQQARQTYRGPMALINAREIGEGLLNSGTHYTEMPGILQGMAPEQRAALQLGMRNHMADIAGRPGASAQLRNIRENLGPDNRRKIEAIIGPERADAYINALQQEERMHFGPQRLIQGSDTGQNLAYRQLLEPPGTPSLLSRAVGVGADLMHPRAAAARMAREAIERGDEAAAGREAQRWQGIRADLSRLLTTQGPERDAIRRALVQRIQEGEGGLAGPVGRQPLAPTVLERGRSGRPIRRSKLPIGTEGQILERAEQRLGEGPRVVGSQKEMDDILKKNWAENGRELDYEDVWQRHGPDVWAQEIEAWNKAHPEKPMPGPDDRYTFGDNREFEQQFENKHLKDANGEPLRQPYPGAREANRYFAEDQPELTAFTSHRQMRNLENDTGIQLLPDKMQAMAFKDEPTRRRFLQGMASAVAATNPELGKIAAGLTKATASLPRLEDAGYGRSLARQAMYMFNDDKAAALDYLMDHVKHSRPGSVVDKANQDAVRHITSGDIDKEPGIWAKSVAEMRAHDEQIKIAQAARRAAEQTTSGAQEEPIRGRRELPGGEGQLEAPRRADQEAGRAGETEPPLEGLPRKVTVPGIGKIEVGPHQPIRDLAHQYMQDAGLPYNPPREYAKVDPARARRIADEYEKMAHAPGDPEVKAAYDAMAKETMAQWQVIKGTGFKAEFIPPGSPDPYAASPRLATEDIKNNNHMWVFSTRDGFGTLEGFDPSTNPLLADSGEKFGSQPALLNDIFRVVHDYFGHAKEGIGFRADGEENAWRSHSAMYSPEARKAMTSETRGQNSWLNYGPHGDKNRSAKTEDTVFADQKTGILPDWVVNEGSGLPERQPLARDVTERGRSGRPIGTTPMATGREADVLRSGYERATGEHPDRIGTRSGGEGQPATKVPETVRSAAIKKNDQINARGKGEKGFPREHLVSENTEFRRQGGRVSAPLSARKKYNYAHNRGTEKEHCSNCSMFRKPHSCTAVGGFIARMGKCDIWARMKRADGGSLFDPTPMAQNSPYSLSQDFHERLPEAEGLIEDRRNNPEDQSIGMKMKAGLIRAAQQIERDIPGLSGPLFPPRSQRLSRPSGKLPEDLGYKDIGREHKAFGGGFSPWQGMMRQPWWNSLMRRQGGMGTGPMPNPPALGRPQFQQPQPNPPAGIAPNPPANPPAMVTPPANPPARMGLQSNPPTQVQSVMSAVTGDAPPMMTGDSVLPAPTPNPPATSMTQSWRGSYARPPGMAHGGRLGRQDGGRVSHFDDANRALKMTPTRILGWQGKGPPRTSPRDDH